MNTQTTAMDEQMNFIVHFDWMSFSDGVVPIYSLKSRHEKRQDKKHSHYPRTQGKPTSPQPLGAQLSSNGPHTLSLPQKPWGLAPPNGLAPPASAWLNSAFRPSGLPGRQKGAAEGSLLSRVTTHPHPHPIPTLPPGWEFILLK